MIRRRIIYKKQNLYFNWRREGSATQYSISLAHSLDDDGQSEIGVDDGYAHVVSLSKRELESLRKAIEERLEEITTLRGRAG